MFNSRIKSCNMPKDIFDVIERINTFFINDVHFSINFIGQLRFFERTETCKTILEKYANDCHDYFSDYQTIHETSISDLLNEEEDKTRKSNLLEIKERFQKLRKTTMGSLLNLKLECKMIPSIVNILRDTDIP